MVQTSTTEQGSQSGEERSLRERTRLDWFGWFACIRISQRVLPGTFLLQTNKKNVMVLWMIWKISGALYLRFILKHVWNDTTFVVDCCIPSEKQTEECF